MPASMPFPMPPPVIGSIIRAASPTSAMPLPTDFLIGGAVGLQDRGRGRLQPDVGAGLRGLFGDRFVERVPLEDDADLVPRMGLLDRELGAVRREDLGPFHLAADPFLVEREVRVLDEVAGQAFPAAHRGADLLPLFDQKGATTARGCIAGRHRTRRACADHDDVVLIGGHRVAGPSIGTGYIRLTQSRPNRPRRGYFIVWSLCPRG